MVNTFPKLETKRLTLRQLEKRDSENIRFLRSDESVNQFIQRSKTNTLEDAINFVNKINTGVKEKTLIFWSITLNNNPGLIGTICLWNFSEDKKIAEVGYDLYPKYHKQGIMNEALSNVLNFGFETLNLDTIEAYTHKNNESSKRLLLKNNFTHIPERTDKDNLDNSIYILHK